MDVMVAKYEAAARHLPVAHAPDGRDASSAERTPSSRPPSSEARLSASVVADRQGDDKDPYADVPCTD